MPVVVYTARVSYGGVDRLDITRQYGGRDGLPFAPSWSILRPMLDARARWKTDNTPVADRGSEETALWETYTVAYLKEMRVSYRRSRAAWRAVLARSEVTLCCVCTDATHCHRTLMAGVFGKLGATIAGERPR